MNETITKEEYDALCQRLKDLEERLYLVEGRLEVLEEKK